MNQLQPCPEDKICTIHEITVNIRQSFTTLIYVTPGSKDGMCIKGSEEGKSSLSHCVGPNQCSASLLMNVVSYILIIFLHKNKVSLQAVSNHGAARAGSEHPTV